MGLTKEKSEQQADIIKMIALPVIMLDTEYCTEAAKDMRRQASFQQSISILNPKHSPTKDSIVYKQADALMHLVKYVESLKEIEELKSRLRIEEEQQAKIAELFL